MPKSKKLDRRYTNADFRARNHLPSPPLEEIESRLRKCLTAESFAGARLQMHRLRLRERLLTLPVMTALVLSLVLRRVPYLSELLRLLEREGLFDCAPVRITKQALSQRLDSLPASLFAEVFNAALTRLETTQQTQVRLSGLVERLRQKFPACYVADGSTLEALRGRLKESSVEGEPLLGGKMMGVIDFYTRRAVRAWYSPTPQTNDKSFLGELLPSLCPGSLLIFDLGFFSFPFFDELSEGKISFVTRLREKTAYRVVEVLSEGRFYRDEIIEMGLYRSNPCEKRVRLVSVLWGKTWYRYVTNVLPSERLSACEVCELYRHRWRIEEAFLVTKRLLGLSYLWTASRNGVEIQVYATWLFYAVLMGVCVEVGEALGQPLERISTEMVFRGLYHFGRAIEMGEQPELISFFVQHAKLLGLVKAKRKRHRERETQNQMIWDGLT